MINYETKCKLCVFTDGLLIGAIVMLLFALIAITARVLIESPQEPNTERFKAMGARGSR